MRFSFALFLVAWMTVIAPVESSSAADAVKPPRAAPPRLVAQLGHSQPIESLAVSPDGQIIATGGGDGWVILWDAATLCEIRRLRDPLWKNMAAEASGVEFSPDGKWITAKVSSFLRNVLSGPAAEYYVWEVASGRHQILNLPTEPKGKWDGKNSLPLPPHFGALKFVPNRKTIVAEWDSPAFFLSTTVGVGSFSLESGDRTSVFQNANETLLDLAVSSDGAWAIAGEPRGTARIWNIADGKELRCLPWKVTAKKVDDKRADDGRPPSLAQWRLSPVLAVAISPDGRQVAIGNQAGDLGLFQVRGGETIWFKALPSAVERIKFAPGGDRLVVRTCDTFFLTNTVRGEIEGSFPRCNTVACVAFSPDGTRMVAGGCFTPVRMYDTSSGKLIRSFRGPRDWVDLVVVTPDATQVVAHSRDGFFWKWNAETGIGRRWSDAVKEDPPGNGLDPHAMPATASTSDEESWKLPTGRPVRLESIDYLSPGLAPQALSGNHRWIATGGTGPAARKLLWDVFSEKWRELIPARNGLAKPGESNEYPSAISNDGQLCLFEQLAGAGATSHAASSSERTHFELRNSPPLKPPANPPCQFDITDSSLLAPILSSDGAWLALIDTAGKLEVRRTIDGKVTAVCEGLDEPMLCISFSPDGRLIAAGSTLGKVVVWERSTSKVLQRFAAHARAISALAFDPKGKTLVTASTDQTVLRWDLISGREITRFESGGPPPVADMALAADGRLLMALADGSVQVRQGAKGEVVQRAAAGGGSVNTACHFSADGLQAITATSPVEHFEILEMSEMGELAEIGGFFACRSTLSVWNLSKGRIENAVNSPLVAGIYAAGVDAGGNGLTTIHAGGGVVHWTGDSVGTVHTPRMNSEAIVPLALSPNLRRAIVVPRSYGAVEVWDVSTGASLSRLPNTLQYWLMGTMDSWQVTNCFSSDGRLILASRAEGQEAIVIDSASGRVVCHLSGHSGPILSWAFAPNGKTAATCGADGTVRIWDSTSGAALHVLQTNHQEALSLVFAADGNFLFSGTADGTVQIWDTQSGKELRHFTVTMVSRNVMAPTPDKPAAPPVEMRLPAEVQSMSLSPDGRILLVRAELRNGPNRGGEHVMQLWDIKTGRLAANLESSKENDYAIDSMTAFSPDGGSVLGWDPYDGTATLWDAGTGRVAHNLTGHVPGVRGGGFLVGGRVSFTCSGDGRTRLWDVKTGKELCTLIAFTNGSWAVVDPEGRFDATNGGDFPGMHWVVGNEPIEFRQLKDRYFDPGLLAKKIGLSAQPLRDVELLDDLKLHPRVELTPPGTDSRKAVVRLTNRGGGLGRVVVRLNGKEFTADARPPGFDPQARDASIAIDLTSDPRLIPGEINRIEVAAFNAQGNLSSRGIQREFRINGTSLRGPPQLWAMVAGVAEYRGHSLDLCYAAKDAEDFAHALDLAAGRLFGVQNTHVELLTTSASAAYPGLTPVPPTRKNLLAALAKTSQARSHDVIVIYLAGHGATQVGGDREFYFLTMEAQSTDISSDDPEVRRLAAISSTEFIERLKLNRAGNQVLILDTCASGRLVEQILAKREIYPTGQRLALERLKDRAGLHILAGCAADRASYEASRFGQGLLTYSLLFGMRGAALRDDQFVDVSRLFEYAADQVPRLAGEIGGVQKPVIAMPPGMGSIDIGQILADDKPKIPLQQVRPMVLRANFQDSQQMFDHLELSDKLTNLLRDEASHGRQAQLVFVDTTRCPGGWRISGTYTVSEGRVDVRAVIVQDNKVRDHFTVDGSTAHVDKIAGKICDEIIARLQKAVAE